MSPTFAEKAASLNAGNIWPGENQPKDPPLGFLGSLKLLGSSVYLTPEILFVRDMMVCT